jgi:hypothetical protein
MRKRKECLGDRAGRRNPESLVQDLVVNDIREVQQGIEGKGMNYFLTLLGVLSECDNSYLEVMRLFF